MKLDSVGGGRRPDVSLHCLGSRFDLANCSLMQFNQYINLSSWDTNFAPRVMQTLNVDRDLKLPDDVLLNILER
jgi:hypothetical protein